MVNTPAIEGGSPVRREMLPYGQQWIDEDDIKGVVDVLKGDYLTTGPRINDFECRFAEYVGARYAVAVANGTAALHAAAFAAGIGPGDEVITTPITFAASANCVLYMGGKPVFSDIRDSDWNIDQNEIEGQLSSRTKAIIPVHFTGLPVDIDEIQQIAREHNLVVIEDAAHALGATYKGQRIGGLSQMTIFSFHPVKHITTGEGGMITTDDKELYQRLVQFRSHGITRDRQQLRSDEGPWYYEMQFEGYNYRLTDLQAALGLSQLAKADRFLKRRREIVARYIEAFKDIPEISLQVRHNDRESGWHLFIIRLDTGRLKVGRRRVFEALRAENVGVNVHYIPVYLHPYYRDLGYPGGLCPRAEKLYSEIITLPLFPKMTKQDVDDVIEAVHRVVTHYRR